MTKGEAGMTRGGRGDDERGGRGNDGLFIFVFLAEAGN